MITELRLTWRLQRWEIAVLLGGSLLFAAITALSAWQLSTLAPQVARCAPHGPDVVPTPACQSTLFWASLFSGVAPVLEGATAAVPFIVGILLGAPLVSREIERRTAPLGWWLSLSRARWLILRAGPLLVAIGAVLLLVGVASDALIRAVPYRELTFRDYGMHGPLIAVRGMAVFCIGVLVGVWLGRVLPAILVTGLVVMALLVGLQIGRDHVMRTSAAWIRADAADFSSVIVYDQAWVDDATGRVLTDEEVQQAFQAVPGPEGPAEPPGMSELYLATPPGLLPVFEAGESGVLLVIGMLAAGGALWRVRSRRPDLA